MPRRQRRLRAAVALLVVAATPLSACGGDDDDDPAADEPAADTSTTAEPTTSEPEVPTEDVTFTTSDGVLLAGRFYGSGTTAIVASHMANSSKADYAGSAPGLASEGFTVFAYDGRGDGDSSPGDPTQRVQDLLAAVDLVRSRGATKVFLLGASRGGGLALTAAALTPVDGVVTLSAAPPSDGAPSVAAVTAPSLYVNSEDDEFADTTQEMYDAANEPRELQMYPGGDHGTELFRSQSDLIDLITTFIREHGGA